MNKVFGTRREALISLTPLDSPPVIHRAIRGITLFTRFRSQARDLRYALLSSLKELSATTKIERELSSGSGIIPGDWGKVGPGWLARLLSSRGASRGGWRQDSPVPLATFARRQSTRKRNLARRSDEKPLRIESSSPGRFRAWVNRSYPEGNRLLLCISTGRATLADSIKPFETAQRKPSKDGQTERTHREEPADASGRGKIFRAPAMLKTTPLVCERKAT